MADRKETDLNEYIQNIFSANGVQAPISIEEWTGGWAVIVGGVNGIPTAQQFNRVFYIINAILKEMFGNVSDIQRTANDALPKVNFTASAIVELLKPYGLMVGCDADLLDGKHAEAFALKQHSHAASDINSGVLTIAHGGTGSSDKDIARENLGAAPKQHNHPASDINSGIFPIGRGGTGASSKDAARENLGAAPKQHNHPASDINSGVFPIERGGTGASNRDTARDNLGAAPKQHGHAASDINSGVFPIERGGTGSSNRDAARENLGAAPKQHNHPASDINSGIFPIGRGGTGASNAAGACSNIGAMPTGGGTFHGTVSFGNTTYYINTSGVANFSKCYGAVYNDYAEWFPRGGETEPGDIIALDVTSQNERYVRADARCKMIAGVHSDEYAMLIGGEYASDTEDYHEKNIGKYIPVALAGRVMTRVTGPICTGDIILPSDIPGVGRAARKDEQYSSYCVVGYAVESDDRTDVRRLRIRVGR